MAKKKVSEAKAKLKDVELAKSFAVAKADHMKQVVKDLEEKLFLEVKKRRQSDDATTKAHQKVIQC